jgi:hypothetical protein
LLNNSVILSIKEAVDNQNLSIDVFRDISSSSYLLYLVNVSTYLLHVILFGNPVIP